jgi:large subunit ribosomal protein L25
VPLEPVGIPNGVKNFGGLLEQNVRALTIECLPKDLPDKLSVDVSALNIGDAIHVRDIALPEGVRTKIQPDLTVFSVLAPTVEEEPVAEVAAEGAAAGPEVIREKKEEPEGAAAAGSSTAKAATAKEKEAKK